MTSVGPLIQPCSKSSVTAKGKTVETDEVLLVDAQPAERLSQGTGTNSTLY